MIVEESRVPRATEGLKIRTYMIITLMKHKIAPMAGLPGGPERPERAETFEAGVRSVCTRRKADIHKLRGLESETTNAIAVIACLPDIVHCRQAGAQEQNLTVRQMTTRCLREHTYRRGSEPMPGRRM